MKKYFVISTLFLLLAGCNAAPHLDKEFGKAHRESFDMQIAYPDYRYADKNPEGIAGLTAEGIMEVYTDDFGKPPTDVNVFQLGIEGGQ